MTIWEDIFKHLKSKGFDVNSPGVKVGECKSNYIVLMFSGASQHSLASTNVELYDILLYVPEMNYSALEGFRLDVMKAMKELEPKLLPYGIITPSFHDQEIKAHTVTITYKNYKKML